MKKLLPGELVAVLYADIFDYALTSEQAHIFSINKKLFNSLKADSNKIYHKDQYYFLKGREMHVAKRIANQQSSRLKLQRARKVAKLLSYLPAIQLIGVSGALAMENAHAEDDIDFLIVTKCNRIWMVRCLSIFILDLLGLRRQPTDSRVSDKICLNMFIDEDHIGVPQKERDVFSAHEVAQMKILFERNRMGERFLASNRWIKKYLPNYQIPNFKHQTIQNYQKTNKKIEKKTVSEIFNFIEKICRSFQLYYMKSRITREVIKDGYLRFHPKDARSWIVPAFEKRLKRFGMV